MASEPSFNLWNVVSLDNLDGKTEREGQMCFRGWKGAARRKRLTWEPKFSRVRAAVNVDLTAERYGRRALDCRDPFESEKRSAYVEG